MLLRIEARNDEWNRKYGFTDESSEGFLVEIRNGTAYFGWKFKGSKARFYTCEQPVFEKHFSQVPGETVKQEMDPEMPVSYARYPIEQ
jgi:hypothetical protein